MGRRLVISDGSHAQEIQDTVFKAAVDGVVKQLTIACVAQGGVVRQFWPPVADTYFVPNEILWTMAPITVSAQETAPLEANAVISFIRDSGYAYYDNDPDASVFVQHLNPPLDGTPGDDNKYLIKVDQVSGATINGTVALGSWHDLNNVNLLEFYIPQSGVGSSAAVATITIAEDDGGGLPEIGTSIAKTVNFSAVVISSGTEGTTVWSDSQRDLVEVKESVDADCILTFHPEGAAIGSADTSGSFNENWHSDTPAVVNPVNFTVNATLVSGTAPTGSALGSNLTLDEVRQWTLLATSGENLNCALDVTVNDGIASVTKRVTMNSQRIAAITSNVWTVTQWFITDSAELTAPGASITLGIDGVGLGKIVTGGATQETENWHSQAPAPSDLINYECKLDVIAGIAGFVTGSAKGTWLTLTSERKWEMTIAAGNWHEIVLDVSIRRVGEATITKRAFVELGVEPPL